MKIAVELKPGVADPVRTVEGLLTASRVAGASVAASFRGGDPAFARFVSVRLPDGATREAVAGALEALKASPHVKDALPQPDAAP